MPVTLLTDFGTTDYFVGAMKGVVLTHAPDAILVDLTHEVLPQDVQAGAFTLLAAYTAFPAGTVHLAVVDPGVGSARRALVVAAAGSLFVGPDNGLFSYVMDREPDARAFHASDPDLFRHPVSTTFHGRDVFAPVAGALAAGLDPAAVGPEVDDAARLPPIEAEPLPAGGVRGAVIHIDHFGNCLTSLAYGHLPDGLRQRAFTLHAGGREIRTLRRFFAEPASQPDAPFMIWGSAGFLEIAVNRASAADRLGLHRGDPVELHPL